MKPNAVKILVAAFIVMVSGLGQVARAEEAPNCLKDVKAGEWVLYKLQGGMKMKQTVTAVTDKEVTLSTQVMMNDKAMGPAQETRIPREAGEDKKKEEGVKPKISSATVKVKGKEIKCVVIEVKNAKTYLSNEIPVTGMVKSEADGKVAMELVDFGTE